MSKAPVKATEEAPAPTKSLYRLARRYWDGRREHPIDSLLYFTPGTQPKSAQLVSEQELPEISGEEEAEE